MGGPFTLRGCPEPRNGPTVEAPRGLPRARSGGVFSGYGTVFSGQPEKYARGLARTIISGPIRGRFFQVTAPFFRLTGKNKEPRWRANYLSTESGSFFQVKRIFQVNRGKVSYMLRDLNHLNR